MRRSIYGCFALTIALTLAPLGGQAVAQTTATPDVKDRFRATDRNGDGRIDREEFQQWMVEVFFFLDKDRNGYLLVEEVRGVGLGPEAFKAANTKGDGKLSLREFLNAVFVDFQVADVDKDGMLTFEEFQVYTRGSAK